MKLKTLHLVITIGAIAQFSNPCSHAATLAALWEFEETSGLTAADSTAGILMDVLDGADLSAAGKFGSGVDFSNDTPQAARGVLNTTAGNAAAMPTGDFSVLVWIRPTTADLANTFNRFIDTSSNTGGITTGYRLMTHSGTSTDNFRFLGDSGANTSVIHPRDLAADTWTLLAVRYDTDGLATTNVLFATDTVDSVFVNGNIQTGGANGPIVYAAGENTNFASMDNPVLDNNEYEGGMDDAAFFTGLLTDAEIASVFNSGVAATFIPEPSASLLLVGGLLGACLRRRR